MVKKGTGRGNVEVGH